MTSRLKRSRTMKAAAEEGENFLKRTWGEAKYECVQKIMHGRDGSADLNGAETEEEVAASTSKAAEPRAKKPRLAKNTTMVATAKESENLLKDTKIDKDARTRGQSKEISKLTVTKPRLAKKRTMIETTKESEILLKDANIDTDAKTRNQSKEIKKLVTPKPILKKSSTMTATTKEALYLLTREPLRSRTKKSVVISPPKVTKKPKTKSKPKPKASAKKATAKPQLKKAGTMLRTANEGKEFLKRQNTRSSKKN